MSRAGAFSPDAKLLVCLEGVRQVWNVVVATVYKSADDMRSVVFAAGGGQAFVSSRASGSSKFNAAIVDLATGKATMVGDALTGGVSADGAHVALYRTGEVRVLEVATKNVVWQREVVHQRSCREQAVDAGQWSRHVEPSPPRDFKAT